MARPKADDEKDRVLLEYSEGIARLMKASAAYAKGAKLMEEFSSIFPFAFQGQMTKSDRKRGAEILRKIKPLEEQAIDLMKKSTA